MKPIGKERYFEKIADAQQHEFSLASGTEADRVAGLAPLLARAKGARVLDLGCYMGWVSLAFAEHGAAAIDAVDLYAPGVENARQSLASHRIEARVHQCDLRGGEAALGKVLPGDHSYDIVLYLGLHHHLRRALDKEELGSFVSAMLMRTRGFFAVRTTEKYFAELEDLLARHGSQLWYEVSKTETMGRLQVYAVPDFG